MFYKGDYMKLKSGIFVCSTVLTILLGLSVQTQQVEAQTTDNTDVQVEQKQTQEQPEDSKQTNDENSQKSDEPASADSDQGDQIAGQDAQTEQENKAGGQWHTSPSTATPQSNFYNWVNKDWLSSVEVSEDNYIQSNDTDQQKQANEDIAKDIADVASGKDKTDVPQIQQAAEYYKKYLDTLNSSEVNTGSLQTDVEKIASLKDYQDLMDNWDYFARNGFDLPVTIQSSPTLQDNSKSDLMIYLSASMLPDLSVDSVVNKDYISGMTNVMKLIGINSDQAHQMIRNALSFGNSLNSGLLGSYGNNTSIEQAQSMSPTDMLALMKTTDLSELYQKEANLNFKEYITKNFPTATTIQNFDTSGLVTYNNIFSLPNFNKLKDWMMVSLINENLDAFGKTGSDLMAAYNKDQMIFSESAGVTTNPTNEQLAFNVTEQIFPEELSMLYGMKHLGNDAKNRLTLMVTNIRNAYETRLRNNTWLSDATKQKAIDKLEKMIINVGYPSKISSASDYTDVTFEQSDSLYDINKGIARHDQQENIANYTKPVDRDVFPNQSYVWNSFYYPIYNSINLEAAMLQAPVFSNDNTDSQNYGAIGAVIGHEISHAFDITGSQFDANGNLQNWWTDEDKAKFNELAENIVKEYDGIDFDWGVTNGQITENENIADNGGLSVALEVAKQSPNFSAKEFYESWGKVWRMKVYKDAQAGLMVDAHSPYPIRVNVTAQNQDDFYSTFNIQPGDPMWLDPSQRVSIW